MYCGVFTTESLVSLLDITSDPPLTHFPLPTPTSFFLSVVCIHEFVFILFVHLFFLQIIPFSPFSICHISLSVIPSRSSHIITNDNISPFFLAK